MTDMKPFADTHSDFERKFHDAPAWMKAVRQDAFARFAGIGLPTRRDEEWKYTSLRPLAERGFEVKTEWSVFDDTRLAGHVSKGDMALVFVDGVLSTAHSHLGTKTAGLKIQPLVEAAREREAEISALIAAETDGTNERPFPALNRAFLQAGVVIQVAAKTAVEPTIHIIYAASEQAGGTASFPRNVIIVGEGSEVSVVETYLGVEPASSAAVVESEPYLVSAATDIALARNARLLHTKVVAFGAGAVHIGTTKAKLQRDAHLQSFVHCQGGRLTRNDLDVELLGEGAHAALDGLYLTNGDEHVDNHTSIEHAVPRATSSQLYKGILNGASRAVFNGKVFVRQDAQQTAAYQLNRNLLLSSEAEIDTKPELQIDADDVKCSHGAAIGQLNDDEIFYLQSRGIERDQAVAILSQAFADEALLKIEATEVRERLRQLTMRYFK